MDSDFRKDDFFYLSQEDRDRQKREQEESRRVLQELKSVLGLRASEAERQKWKRLLFSDHAVLKPLCPVDPVEPLSNSEPSMNSDLGKVGQNGGEAEASRPCVTDSAVSRTEYLCGVPPEGEDPASPAGEALPGGAEEGVCFQCDSEADPPWAAQPAPKQRLARLQLCPKFTFTAGLAAEAAARSLSFTAMQEQTFGDEDEQQVTEEDQDELEGQPESGCT